MAGHRRKLKRFRMQAAETQEVTEQMMLMASAHGISIQFPWELPGLLQQLLEAQGAAVGAPTGRMQSRSTRKAPAAARLGQSHPSQPLALPAPPLFEEEEDVEIDPFSVASISAQDEEEEPEGPTPEMIAEYERRQNAMFTRVQTQGVQYGKTGAPSPAQGKRLVADPRAHQMRPVQPPEEEEDLGGLETEEEEEFDFDFGSVPVDDEPAPPRRTASPGRAPATSVAVRTPGPAGNKQASLEEKRNILSRLTGREVKAPKGSGIPIPPGFGKK